MSANTGVAWTAKYGPPAFPPRDGDKRQARQRVNVLVRTGRLAHPNQLPCVDCGHVHKPGERRHEYDHYLGYAPEHHYEVQVVCTLCHARRDNPTMKTNACKRGHAFTPENTKIRANGTRDCRECRRARDRVRRDASFWREYRRKRRG